MIQELIRCKNKCCFRVKNCFAIKINVTKPGSLHTANHQTMYNNALHYAFTLTYFLIVVLFTAHKTNKIIPAAKNVNQEG